MDERPVLYLPIPEEPPDEPPEEPPEEPRGVVIVCTW